MKQQNAKELLPLIQALAEGKIIQEDISGQWCDTEVPTFFREVCFYRVKPEFHTFDIWINKKTKRVVAVEDGDHGKDDSFFEWERITVMEVIK